MTFCRCGYWATSSITQIIKCPICPWSIQVLSPEDTGRHAWFRLHTEPLPTPKWYTETWLKLVPKHGCQCYDHWRRVTLARPPDFSSLENFRRWAIEAHNDVNRLIGKPLWHGNTSDAASTLFAISPGAIE